MGVIALDMRFLSNFDISIFKRNLLWEYWNLAWLSFRASLTDLMFQNFDFSKNMAAVTKNWSGGSEASFSQISQKWWGLATFCRGLELFNILRSTCVQIFMKIHSLILEFCVKTWSPLVKIKQRGQNTVLHKYLKNSEV